MPAPPSLEPVSMYSQGKQDFAGVIRVKDPEMRRLLLNFPGGHNAITQILRIKNLSQMQSEEK